MARAIYGLGKIKFPVAPKIKLLMSVSEDNMLQTTKTHHKSII